MVASDSQVKIKVCGMTSLKDTLVAVEEGADAVGFIFYKKSPRSVTMKIAREIILELPPFVDTVGVFVDETEEKIWLRETIERHQQYTGSQRADNLLKNWDEVLAKFVKVMPIEYKAVLEKLQKIPVEYN